MKDIFMNLMFNMVKKYTNFIMMEIEKVENLVINLCDKTECYSHK